MLDVRVDNQAIKRFERQLAGIPRALPQVMSRGLNRTATEARTLMVKYAAKTLKQKQKTVRPYHPIKKATQANWHARIDISLFRPQLIDLSVKQVKSGVRYRSITGQFKILPHAFIATGPKKGTQVWLRSLYVLGFRKYITWKERHMEALYLQRGHSIGEFWKHHIAKLTEIRNQSMQRLGKNIHDQIQMILRWRAG